MNTTAICQDDRRREQVRARPELNGLDYLEVDDAQPALTVYFLGKAPVPIKKGSVQYVRIEGGRRIRDIKVIGVEVRRETDPELDDRMIVRLNKSGDFSTYTLRLVGLDGIDPRYDRIEFNFKLDCPSDIDCAPTDSCPPPQLVEPEINYLAKDYASFRQLILDRLALIMPGWQERHVPDIGVALVEVLAYVGDHLSYYQDAVATEAYLDTARQRVSVRRHARLVDYALHEGCNARAWVCIEAEDDMAIEPRDTFFITGLNDLMLVSGATLRADDLRQLPNRPYEVFEPVGDRPIQLYTAHNTLRFYTWGERSCCLPRGATSATLRYEWMPAEQTDDRPSTTDHRPANKEPRTTQRVPDREPQATGNALRTMGHGQQTLLHLKAGDILIFEEVIGPRSGNAADADPLHRHAVRLTQVEPGVDTLYDPPIQIVEIAWAAEDALPFPLCISATSDAPGCTYQENISVARGNVILADHGWTVVPPEPLGLVPIASSSAACDCEGHPADLTITPARFRPRLSKTPLVFGQPFARHTPALRLLDQDPRRAQPSIELFGIPAAPDGITALFEWADLEDPSQLIDRLRAGHDERAIALRSLLAPATLQLLDKQNSPADSDALRRQVAADLKGLLQHWTPRPDLIESRRDDRHFVAEIENDGRARLRFGDGELGRMPGAGTAFYARYRVGGGVRGNVGAEAIAQLVFRSGWQDGIIGVRNPLPARGGADPEPIAEAKLFAPSTFRKDLRRAIIADDYVQLVQREFAGQVQRAAATLQWSGSWYDVLVAIDPLGGEDADPALLRRIAGMLHRYRRIGHNVAVRPARYASLDIELDVCVKPHYLRGHIKAALLDVFSSRALPNGKRGFFHPDNLSFGESIALSKLVAAAQAVEGVASVEVTRLQRQFDPPGTAFSYTGILPIGPLEVARLDNDPSFPEHGRLKLKIGGGR
jgi:predicted phage baseplate assembly protein